MAVHAANMTKSNAATIDALQSVPHGEGDHYFFLNHLATVKVGAGKSDSGLTVVEFVAPRGFGPLRHQHAEEDELMYILDGEIRIDLGNGESTIASAGAVVTLPHGIPQDWQVVSETARFLAINAGRRDGPSFDNFVAALGHRPIRPLCRAPSTSIRVTSPRCARSTGSRSLARRHHRSRDVFDSRTASRSCTRRATSLAPARHS